MRPVTDPVRVISLLPAATDIVAALGAAANLVGITHECDDPAHEAAGATAGATGRRRVTSSRIPDGPAAVVDAAVHACATDGLPLFTLDADGIRALRPDLLLTQALCDVCAVREGDVRALAADLSPPAATLSLAATTLDGVLEDIVRVADALGIPERGAALSASLRARLLAVHERLRAAAAPRPRVAVLEWPEPLYTAGHWVPEMVRRAGGREVLATAGAHSVAVAASAVEAADPEVLIVAPCGYDAARAADTADRLLARPEWRWARARAVWALDANALTSRPGPRLVRGVEVIAALLHPMLFPTPARTEAVPVPTPPAATTPSAAVPSAAMPAPTMPSAAAPSAAMPAPTMPRAAVPSAAVPAATVSGEVDRTGHD